MNDSFDKDKNNLAATFLNEAEKEGKGKLKIFLGAAPGVGKTYAMLQAAHERKNEGVDVVIAVVETHGRVETQKLVEGLEIIPRKKIVYRNKEFDEMDLEGILKRKPQIVLVDELAHTNVPGSIHEKRYQDIEILLSNQIDVYTTLNIQHLESLNDIVSQITKVKIRETLPDHILRTADEVELVDLPPKELIRRLSEGKVYVKDQARKAIKNFFSPSNLTALRELALRHTAEQVDDQMIMLMQKNSIKGPWPSRDRIVVCIDERPLSEDLVRAASRMSQRRKAPLVAVYVETPAHYMLSDKKKEQIYKTFQLAENLGAETITLTGRSIVDSILDFARDRNVTQLVVGQTSKNRVLQIFASSTTHQIIRKSGGIDVFVISEKDDSYVKNIVKDKISFEKFTLKAYIYSVIAVGLSTGVSFLIRDYIKLDITNLSETFLISVIYIAFNFGLLPSIFTTLLGLSVFDFVFLKPYFTLSFPLPSHALTLITFLGTGFVTAVLAERYRNQAITSQKKEQRTAALYTLSKEMASAMQLDDVLAAIVVKFESILKAETVILLPEEGKTSLKMACPPEFEYDEKEQAASHWSFEHEEMAGQGTETLTTARRLYIPLKTQRGTVAILGIKMQDELALKDLEFRRLLDALSAQSGLAIERARLAEEMEEAIIKRERETLRTTLLSSISYDLKTPLSSIIGSVSAMDWFGKKMPQSAKETLIDIIREESYRLDKFITNLIEMTKIESGAVAPRTDLVDLKELVNFSLSKSKNILEGFNVIKKIPENLPLIKCDFIMMNQVFMNLLENSSKYSNPGSEIIIEAREDKGAVVIDVRDKGIGIPAEELEKVFDKFYKIKLVGNKVSGSGLGLALCKAISEANLAKIEALLPLEGEDGTLIRITFPQVSVKKIGKVQYEH